MGCCSCVHLKEDKKSNGKVNGCVYFCSKKKTYVNGAGDACDKYEVDRLRKTHIRDEIYRDGKNYYNDDTPFSLYLFAAIVLFILGLIFGVFSIDFSSLLS